MKTVLCTLYNSLYLDKGLVLFDSLKECAKDFELYVLCMDEKCYDVLFDIGDERLKPIHLTDIENDSLLEAKAGRTSAEYCWTCTSRIVQYILETLEPECCTYIDADMYFYHDPQILVNEMLMAGKSVMMVPHRFTEKNMHLAKKVGTYCVEFNCFKNDVAGRTVLDYWHKKCLECCSNLGDGVHWGDQKYMDEWIELFPDIVYPCTNNGAGIAPWNIELYENYSDKEKSVLFKEKKETIPIYFYHFQSIKYLSKEIIDTSIKKGDPDIDYYMAKELYVPYLLKINTKKDLLLVKYGVNSLLQDHPSKRNDNSYWNCLNPIHVMSRILEYIRKKDPFVICIKNENII